MNVNREEISFLRSMLSAACRVSKREIAAEIYKPGGPDSTQVAAMRRQQRLAKGLLTKLNQERPPLDG